jgi:two-component system, NarL family, response regulator LiaR
MNLASEKMAGDDQPMSVVICDSHPAFAKGLESLLKDYSHIEVEGVAFSGKEAEILVKDWHPDVVILDIEIPDGIETIKAIRAAGAKTKVVVLTASENTNDCMRAVSAGAIAYVCKTSVLDEIVSIIRLVARGQFVVPALLAEAFLFDRLEPTVLDAEEVKILKAVAKGETNREIASRMDYSDRTIKRKLEQIYAKLHLTDRIEAAIYAANHDL